MGISTMWNANILSPGLELGSPCPFSTARAFTPQAPPNIGTHPSTHIFTFPFRKSCRNFLSFFLSFFLSTCVSRNVNLPISAENKTDKESTITPLDRESFQLQNAFCLAVIVYTFPPAANLFYSIIFSLWNTQEALFAFRPFCLSVFLSIGQKWSIVSSRERKLHTRNKQWELRIRIFGNEQVLYDKPSIARRNNAVYIYIYIYIYIFFFFSFAYHLYSKSFSTKKVHLKNQLVRRYQVCHYCSLHTISIISLQLFLLRQNT